MLELFLYGIGFVLLSGVVSMVDAALLSVNFAEIEEMTGKKLPGAVALRTLSMRLTRAVVIIVIITNTINVLGPILVGQKAIDIFGSPIIGVVTAVLAFSTIVFSEIIPKALGTHYAPVIARTVAPAVLALIWALYPIVLGMEKLVSVFKIGKRPIGTEEQIRALARIGGGGGQIRQSEGELIHRIFMLNDRRARDLMTPRRRIVGVRAASSIRQTMAEVTRHPHSRYPVYDKSLDDVKGIVMNHDLFEAVGRGKEDEPVTTVMREVIFVPASMRSDALLMLFRKRHIHLAVVLDGSKTVGIVSLEDVLEELVGEIEDERDAGKILS